MERKQPPNLRAKAGHMSRPALFTRGLPAARAIARDYRIPGMDTDDVRQEADVALWIATSDYDPSKGAWLPFARMVVKRRLTDLLRSATSQARTAVVDRDVDAADPRDTLAGRQLILPVLDALPNLSDRERRAISDHLNGVPAHSDKAHDNALTRARRKLRQAA